MEVARSKQAVDVKQTRPQPANVCRFFRLKQLLVDQVNTGLHASHMRQISKHNLHGWKLCLYRVQ